MQPRLVIAAWAALALAVGPTIAVRALEADDQYRVAAVHYQREQWDLAATEFRAFLADHPDDSRVDRARFYLAETLVQQRDFAAAAPLFAEVRRAADTELARKGLFRSGETNYLAGRRDDSERDLSAFCERYPDDALCGYAWPFRGEIALAQERYDEAEQCFRTALERFPEGPLVDDCRLGLAQACLKQHRTAEANRLLAEVAAAEGPKAAEARFRLATSEYAAEDYVAAEKSFAVAERAEQRPLAEKASLGRARSLYHLQKYDDAATTLVTISAHATLGGEARYWLGLTRKAQGQWDEAALLLADAAESTAAPDRQAVALAELAACHAAAKQFDKARTAYKTLQGKEPSEELLRSTTEILANAALTGDDAAWSVELFASLAVDKQPPATIARALFGLARAQCATGQPAGAEETLARLGQQYAQEPCAPDAALLRGQVLEQLGRTAAALAAYDDVGKHFENTPQAVEALSRSARLCYAQERWDDAAKLYERLATHADATDNDDTVLYWWAWSALRGEKRDQAVTLFERVRAEHPDSTFYGDATCRLAQEAIRQRDYARADELLASLDKKTLSDDVQVRAWYLAGQSAAAQEKWERVIPPLARLVSEESDSPLRPAAEYWIAEAEYRQDHFDVAGRRFQLLAEAVATMPVEGAPAWRAMIPLRRAQILAQQGLWSEALDMAAGIAARHSQFPQQFEADYTIGRAHAARGEFDEARQAYRRVLRSTTGGKTETAAMAQWMLGETFMHQRDYRAALREYLKVEILHPFPRWQAAALLQAGKCHEFLEESTEAADAYQRLLREYPHTTFDEEAALRLAQLRR